MRQYVADASLTHRMHRDTIRQAITFVWACFVKGETRHECVMALWGYFDIRAAENFLSLSDRSSARLSPYFVVTSFLVRRSCLSSSMRVKRLIDDRRTGRTGEPRVGIINGSHAKAFRSEFVCECVCEVKRATHRRP